MRIVLEEIQDGTFARNWILENKAGLSSFLAKRRRSHQHQVERVGDELRSMMAWLKK